MEGFPMSLDPLCQVDGRFPRALRAIRKLVALGFTEADISKLMRWYRARTHKSQHQDGSNTHPDMDKDERLRLAQWSIRTMLALGFSECEIAALAEVDHSTIAHALDPSGDRAIGQETVSKLKEAVRIAGTERLKQLLPRLAIHVLDTCVAVGGRLDEATRGEIAAGLRIDLQNALVLASSPAPVIPGIHASLAQIGDPIHGLYLIKAPLNGTEKPGQRVDHLRLVEHEIEHLLERFRAERKHLENQKRRDPDLPKEGRIA
jgi:DNA-binding transcriptional MerR regulator